MYAVSNRTVTGPYGSPLSSTTYATPAFPFDDVRQAGGRPISKIVVGTMGSLVTYLEVTYAAIAGTTQQPLVLRHGTWLSYLMKARVLELAPGEYIVAAGKGGNLGSRQRTKRTGIAGMIHDV